MWRNIRRGYPFACAALFLYLACFPGLIPLYPYLFPLGLFLLLCIVALEVIWSRGQSAFHFGPIEGLLVVILCAYAATFLFTDVPVVIFDAVGRLLMLLELFLLFYFLRSGLKDDRRVNGSNRGRIFRRNLMVALIAVIGIQLISGMVQVLIQTPYRVGAHIGNPNFYGSLMGSGFCLLLPFASNGTFLPGRRGGYFLLALFLLIILLILATRSRGGAVALFLSIVLFIWLKKGSVKTLLCVVLVVLVYYWVPNPLRERVTQLNPSVDQFERSFIWRVSLANLLDHPLGLGPNMGKYHFAKKAQELAPLEDLIFKKTRDPVHNLNLEVGVEGGVVALTALLMLLFLLAVRGVKKRLYRDEDPLAFGAGLALLAFFFHAQVECLDRCPMIGAVAAALLGIFLEGGHRPDVEDTPTRRHRGRGRMKAVCLFAAFIIALPMLSWHLSEPLRITAGLGRNECPGSADAKRRLSWAMVLCPWNYQGFHDRFTFLSNRLDEHAKEECWKKAAEYLEEALALNPLSPSLYRAGGNFLARMPAEHAGWVPRRKAIMRELFRTADELDPVTLNARFNGLIKTYIPGHPQAFLDHSEVLDNLPLNFAPLAFNRGLCFEKIGDHCRALQSYKKAVRAHRKAKILARKKAEGTLLQSFHEMNVSKFRVEKALKRIEILKSRRSIVRKK